MFWCIVGLEVFLYKFWCMVRLEIAFLCFLGGCGWDVEEDGLKEG